ncbi:FAD dependent oxidoreductase [Gymnopus androsaceus JB14]|uniref:FAD dependent oxidoreductase n=1 Tax=Gymnopus androsaceus JB14 TaxID=1447944 RepID=A0A6A4HU75_9AGAR|nr:FAD dependent oxidoreductase [Gymnopus androsaceus JB14]
MSRQLVTFAFLATSSVLMARGVALRNHPIPFAAVYGNTTTIAITSTSAVAEATSFAGRTPTTLFHNPFQFSIKVAFQYRIPRNHFWLDSTPNANPLAKEGSTGPLSTEEADVCIIGSGITGVSVAYHLANAVDRAKQEPLKVVILEARDFCSGATGRNGGHLTPIAFIDFGDLQARYGQQEALKALELEKHTANDVLEFISSQNIADAVDLVAGGHVTMFATDGEYSRAKDDYEAAKAAGVDLEGVEWLSVEEMRSTYGVTLPGARYKGHNLWPLKLVTYIYNYAKSQTEKVSLSLHTSTPVTRVSRNEPIGTTSSRRWKVDTPRGSISCSYVVHATNAYASHLIPHLRGPSGIIPTRGQVVAIRAAVSVEELGGKVSWDGNDGFEYWFPRPVLASSDLEQQQQYPLIILGGGREVESRFELYETDDSKCNEAVGKVLKGFSSGLYSGKFEVGREPEMEWTGIMGFTKSKDPLVGPLGGYDVEGSEYEGQFIAAGYSGHGMPRAYACAEVVASMISADLRGETWNPPKWFPQHLLTRRPH